MLKVFVVSFNVEDSYFYFLMLKVIVFTLRCSKFLLLVLDVESLYLSCPYMASYMMASYGHAHVRFEG